MKNLPFILILMLILVPSMLGYVNKAKAVRENTKTTPYDTYEEYDDTGWDD